MLIVFWIGKPIGVVSIRQVYLAGNTREPFHLQCPLATKWQPCILIQICILYMSYHNISLRAIHLHNIKPIRYIE